MNIFKRIYRWFCVEVKLIYEDFSGGYVKADDELWDIILFGIGLAMLGIVILFLTESTCGVFDI